MATGSSRWTIIAVSAAAGLLVAAGVGLGDGLGGGGILAKLHGVHRGGQAGGRGGADEEGDEG